MHRPARRALPNISFNHPPHTLRVHFTPKPNHRKGDAARPCGRFYYLWQYRIILSADTASEVRQMLSQKRR